MYLFAVFVLQTTNEIPVRSIDVLFSRLPVTVKLNDLGLNESLSVEHDTHISK